MMIDPDEGEITLPGYLLLRFWQVEPERREPPPGWGD